MTGAIAISDEDIDGMTDDACDELARIVQKVVGQKDGGIAGQIYGRHGEQWATVRALLVEHLTTEELYRDADDDDGEPRCSNPGGHHFVCTGTNEGGDDERYHGEGRTYCEHCNADGDA